jgi:tight adherence protein C
MTGLLVPAMICAGVAAVVAYRELGGARFGSRAALARAASYGRRPDRSAAERRGGRELPFVDRLARLTIRVAPGRERGRTAAQLHSAGLRIRPELFLAAKAGLAIGGFLVGLLIGATAGAAATALVLAACGAAVGFVLPDLLVRTRTRARREAILTELPNALDLLAVIVEAGLGLDAALARYAENADGPLAEEIGLLVTELRVGSSRAEVLKRLAERVPAPETKSFVRAVIHADHLGTSLGKTLRTQSQEVRYRRQAVAEETANKAPVKMLFPTVFCIFPVLFVIVLGPVLINLVSSL